MVAARLAGTSTGTACYGASPAGVSKAMRALASVAPMEEPVFVPYESRHVPDQPSEDAARAFYETMSTRRTVRMFSDRPVSRETIEWIVRTAGSAPSGANKQPWRFVCVQDPKLKRKIRRAAEKEEQEFYDSRAGQRWLEDLAPLGTDEHKEFLEVAPWLIVVFRLLKGDDDSAMYYPTESVGIATGLLLAAAHHAGLATVTHTPSPMQFLAEVLGRPAHERAFVLIPVGYPADDCRVPAAGSVRKPLDEIMVVDRGEPPSKDR
jgi:nitroreductase